MNENGITIFTGETLPEKREIPQPNMMQIRSQFVAAMRVPIPRNDIEIIEKVKKLAIRDGNSYFYLWPVKNKKEFDLISGGTIILAEAILYYYTNYAQEDDIEDLGDRWKIKYTIIDFERGQQRSRTNFVYKPRDIPENWDRDRWERMMLNKAKSYTLRDLVLTFIPRTMIDEIIEAAKLSELKKSRDEFNKDKGMNLFTFLKTEYGIEQVDILNFLNISKLDGSNFYKVKNIFSQLRRKEIKAKDILKEKQANKKSEEKPKEKVQSHKEQKKETPFQLAVKSLDLRGISETEICAYFNIEDLAELDCKQGIADLQKIVTNIEGEIMTVEKFKKIGMERFETRMKDNSIN